ncbi:uncharacterized protein METZ01_LOCUS360869 [marine metagenome]|uniref:Uncharacterized protein n=1 Tax=marine metagenome TaxID=408172 RepID=A0A382SEX2_9ZZZZ
MKEISSKLKKIFTFMHIKDKFHL